MRFRVLQTAAQTADQLRLDVICEFSDALAFSRGQRNHYDRLTILVQEENGPAEINWHWFFTGAGRLEAAPIERGLHGRLEGILGANDRISAFDPANIRNVTIKLDDAFHLRGGRIFRKMDVTGEGSILVTHGCGLKLFGDCLG